MFEFPFERMSTPKTMPALEQETTTIRVNIAERKAFAVYLAACHQNKEVAEVNGRKATVTDCRLKGNTHLEVDLKFCDFQSLKRVFS